MKKMLLTLSIATLSFSGYSRADWSGDFELGVLNSSGNTANTTVNARADFVLSKKSWRHNMFGHIFFAENSGKRAAENCDIGYKSSYFMTAQNYLFGILRYDQDEFGSIDHRTIEVAGYGRQLFSTPNHTLDAEFGLGARQTDYLESPSTADLVGNELLYFLSGKYVGRISNSARFSETVRVEAGEANSNIDSVTSLGLSITDSLSAKINYSIRFNTDIRGDKGRRLDSLSSVNLVYSF